MIPKMWERTIIKWRKSYIEGGSKLAGKKGQFSMGIFTDPNKGEWTQHDYRVVLRKFVSWLRNEYGYPDGYPQKEEMTRLIPLLKYPSEVIKIKVSRPQKLKAGEDIPTEEEMKFLSDAAINPRDKAFFEMAREVGIRIGGIGSRQIKHVTFDELGDIRDVAVWHDRAVLHFLLEEKQQKVYLSTLKKILKNSGYVIIAAFSLKGAKKCTGLDVKNYDQDLLAESWVKILNCLNILIIHITCHRVSPDRTYMRYSRKFKLEKEKKYPCSASILHSEIPCKSFRLLFLAHVRILMSKSCWLR
jgi:integrase